MPSLDHEALVLLFRNCPDLAAELLRGALGQSVPRYATATVQEADLGQIVPTAYHADLVVVLGKPEPALGIVVEVQLAPDPDKRYVWPLYAAALRAKLRCPACVLVVTPDAAVARWAAQPQHVGPGRSVFAPLVLGPERVPRVTDREVAARMPELAVLSARAHSREPDALPLAEVALEAAAMLEGERAMLYFGYVVNALGLSARRAWEKKMQAGQYPFRNKFAREYLAKGRAEGRAEGEAKGRAQGEAKGRAQGEAKGRAQGEAKGRAQGEAEAVLRVLRARGLQVTAEHEAHIRACTDLPTLEAWLDRTVAVTSVAELLAP